MRVNQKFGFAFLLTDSLAYMCLSGWFLLIILSATNILASPLIKPTWDLPGHLSFFAEDADLSTRFLLGMDFEKNGTAWFAAADGLYRYDGFTWKKYGISNGLPSSYVRCVTVAQNGDIWIGTDKGVCTYNGKIFERVRTNSLVFNRSVRRIFEDPDGTLWFCSDRWPDSSNPGGLVSFDRKTWRYYGIQEGLPNDHVFHYYRHFDGRRFACTPEGMVEWLGDKWGPLRNPGYPPKLHTWMVTGTPQGDIFVQASRATYRLEKDRWNKVEDNSSALCACKDGSIVSLFHDPSRQTQQFTRWNGNSFIFESFSFPSRGSFIEMAKQAPDGAIWAISYGLIVRWEYGVSDWSYFKGLPPHCYSDTADRIWFADKSNTVVYANQSFRSLSQAFPSLWIGVNGDVWGQMKTTTNDSLIRFGLQETNQYSLTKIGIQDISGLIIDPQTNHWFYGVDKSSNSVVTCFNGTQWLQIRDQKLARYSIRSVCSDLTNGIWMVCVPPSGNNYELAYINQKMVSFPLQRNAIPLSGEPLVCLTKEGFWLFGQNGLVQGTLSLENSWRRVNEISVTNGFSHYLSSRNILAIFASGGITGQPGVICRYNSKWQEFFADITQQCFLDREDNLAFADANGFYWLRHGSKEPHYVSIPLNTQIISITRSRDGAFWLGTLDGVLQWRPKLAPIRVQLISDADYVPHNGKLQFRVQVARYLKPQSTQSRYLYSMKIDDLSWSEFTSSVSKTIDVQMLEPGPHQISLRVQNNTGDIIEAMSPLKFRVLATPLQDRVWFKPVLILIAAAILLPSIGFILRVIEIRQTNRILQLEINDRKQIQAELQVARDSLEEKVKLRTAELEITNQSLNREISERNHLENQLRQSQKMEAIGRLAGGIAHDFNNLLTVIQGQTELLQIDPEIRPQQKECLDELHIASTRAANLTRQLLAFSRRQVLQFKSINLNEIVGNLAKMLRRLLGEQITLEMEYQADPVTVYADPNSIEQIIINLSVNSRDAMSSGGTIKIVLGYQVIDESYTQIKSEAKTGRYAFISVIDHGCGMSESTLSKIFEPFFTTKEVGKGTGLGLATVYGIVKQHQGWIDVKSKLGEGSIFTIYLPVATRAISNPLSEINPVLIRGGHETVFVVEDEESVRRLMIKTLQQYGYHVIESHDGAHALTLWESKTQPVDLLITDMVMPGHISGHQLANQLLIQKPELKIIYISGYSIDLIQSTEKLIEGYNYLPKPFLPASLAMAVRKRLDAG